MIKFNDMIKLNVILMAIELMFIFKVNFKVDL